MTTAPILTSVRFQPADINGVPMAGAVLAFFQAQTTTPITVYADAGLITSLGSSVTAAADGSFQPIYLAAQICKTTLTSSTGVLIQTIDNITIGPSATIILQQSATPAPTTEGDIWWDTNDDRIAVGTGGGTATFSNDTTNAATYLGSASIATAAQFMANTASKVIGPNTVWNAGVEVALVDAATVAVDMSTFINANLTLAGNRTLGTPSNAKPGQSGRIRIIQDSSGSRTLAYAANWKFAAGTAPVLSTTANAQDWLYYDVGTSSIIYGNLVKAVA